MAKDNSVAESNPPAKATTVSATPAADPKANGPGRYRVTAGEQSGEYDAESREHAWAQFCDGHKWWPSPKYTVKTIERIG